MISIINLLNIFADHKYTMKIWRMRRQLVQGLVVHLTVIKAKTRPGIEATASIDSKSFIYTTIKVFISPNTNA